MRIDKYLRSIPAVYVEALPSVEDVRVGEYKASFAGIFRLLPSRGRHCSDVSVGLPLMIKCKKALIGHSGIYDNDILTEEALPFWVIGSYCFPALGASTHPFEIAIATA